MSCYQPHIALFDTSTEPRKQLKFLPGNKKNAQLNYEWFDEQNERFKRYGQNLEYVRIGCQNCEGCQESHSKEWAIRCLLESGLHEHNYFVTLTYNEENLPYAEELHDQYSGMDYIDDGTWEYNGGTLNPKDMDKFFDDLLRYYNYHYSHTGIRYFYAGEYGTLGRPHYHAIIFNLPIDPTELKIYRVNTNGTMYYTHPLLSKLWGKGFVVIGEVNWDTCAYTARYVMKKQKGHSRRWYFEQGKFPEYTRMSRRPGIARNAFNKSYFQNDEIIVKGHREQITASKPPKYFDKIYDVIDHDNMSRIKERRKELMQAAERRKQAQTSLTIAEQLKMERQVKSDVWNSLKRDKIT